MSTLLASYNTSTIVFSSMITKEIEDFYSAEFNQCIEIYKFSYSNWNIIIVDIRFPRYWFIGLHCSNS
jgi:hypothetical protein